MHVQTDVARNLPEQRWGDVAAGVKRDCCFAPIGMTVLSVGAALSDFLEAEREKESGGLSGLEDGDRPYVYATRTVWMPTNSDSICGSPSSRSISMTSWRFD